MKQLSYMINRETNPHRNIALEEYLLDHVAEEEMVLYLWQNRKTVVIGYNQNAWRECRVETLIEDGGFVARRLSGGGAVFHDLGNLNFTFLARKANYDVRKQSEVILRAVQSFGIPAVLSGRNDLTAEGRKFSGNAFYRRGDCCYHHGTILIRADKGQMGKYLTVSKEKLRSKGVESVRSRVVNLEEYVPDLTVLQMEEALVRAFGEVYGREAEPVGIVEPRGTVEVPGIVEPRGTVEVPGIVEPRETAEVSQGFAPVQPQPYDMQRIDREDLQKRQERFGSWEWLYGRKIPFQYEVSRKFPWGEVQIQLEVSAGVIRRAVVWTDALDVDFPQYAERWLAGMRYRKEDLLRKLEDSLGGSRLRDGHSGTGRMEPEILENGLPKDDKLDMLADVIGYLTSDREQND